MARFIAEHISGPFLWAATCAEEVGTSNCPLKIRSGSRRPFHGCGADHRYGRFPLLKALFLETRGIRYDSKILNSTASSTSFVSVSGLPRKEAAACLNYSQVTLSASYTTADGIFPSTSSGLPQLGGDPKLCWHLDRGHCIHYRQTLGHQCCLHTAGLGHPTPLGFPA